MLMNKKYTVDQERLWSSLMEMAQIGATDKGGCNRQALTELDAQGRNLLIKWAEDFGCSVMVDEIGNLFIRKEGTDPNLPAVLTGSHLDTQPTGGKFDGVYGVLAGLECMRVLHDEQLDHAHAVELVVWTNEEGARFSPACMGSGVWAGELDIEQIYQVQDSCGETVKSALSKSGFYGEMKATPRAVKAAFELHIEQGPILEKQNKQIGIVTGIQGVRWYKLRLHGKPSHAGPTPMTDRQDPVQAMLPILKACFDCAKINTPWGRATVGDIKAVPGSPNTVPESLEIHIDLRHPLEHILDNMEKAFFASISDYCSEYAVDYDIEQVWRADVTHFDPQCIDLVRQATQKLGYDNMEMVSGAGHDSLYIAKMVPTSMIFVPCKDGLSHNEAEYATPEDLTAGANVLLNTLISSAS